MTDYEFSSSSLDPSGNDWEQLRTQGHRMLDAMIDNLATLRDRPVWQPVPDAIRTGFREAPVPRKGEDPADFFDHFAREVLPYSTGNRHPGFMGWVHGGGTAIGMLAEMLAAGLNANLGGRDHAPVEVERMVIRWAATVMGLPETASGLLVTGSSMANFIAVIVASRAQPDGVKMRTTGLQSRKLTGYAARTVHGCVSRAFDLAGLGTEALRLIPVDEAFRMDVTALRKMIAADRAAGLEPFLVVGTAGTVDTGAIDPLNDIAAVAKAEGLWFHVDGAFGALAVLSDRFRPALEAIGQADSLAFDFHKWAQVPYDAGCVIVRDPVRHAAAFAQTLSYLSREDRGLAAGAPWFCDLGPDLSRGFRALKVWATLSVYGTQRLGEMVDHCCDVAQHLAARAEREPKLELMAPVSLNIVCFRVSLADGNEAAQDSFNAELVKDLQESGIAAPSTTRIGGRLVIRAAIVNHRTTRADVDQMADAVLDLAARRSLPASG
ncbi:pyridoxal phosphate-dependent decarboxylase family protein [Acetobacter oeni]|uniref:Cytochrome d ubiquinol oxidase subunit I n=1 Tax=Acetobacter oeni TaxID=304077 RepID=A0A511XHC9_9PROT|nr:pyridoxal-dependent decarboxylase [Acetobacter oeni]MBB3881203.1 glutamate/tyrosine decarboxylase-like PLP-dependent enzyme [Acetobacter oeni]NHO18079.1 cytochrome D ubiquinol oxidase subunit I [Acetobacter oeni]GBR08379.1 aromatic-L-amino-acid decarboxylase [Acetobacter oeni LMG 21952]GEN62355.1 cytochrome d ubiquinol oxidase subunit I [Acetobacter oeni]